MLGYCSNSPLRCEQARATKILNQVDSCCHECGLFLIPAKDVSQQLRADERFLRLSMLIAMSVMLLSVNIYYLVTM